MAKIKLNRPKKNKDPKETGQAKPSVEAQSPLWKRCEKPLGSLMARNF